MTSMFHAPAALSGWVSSNLHASTAASAETGSSTARSSYGLSRPLSRFIRRPASALDRLVQEFWSSPSDEAMAEKKREERRNILKFTLRTASTLSEWTSAATELDDIEQNNLWKQELETSEYDYRLVQSRLAELEDARISCDVSHMIALLRTSLSRHLGGMGDTILYKHSYIGTKELIERYNRSALDTLSSLLDITRHGRHADIDSRYLLDQVIATRQAFGRSALLLSGGGTFGMNHIGVTKCLWEQRLLPRIVSGASAGSIVAAVLCTRTDDELPQVLAEFTNGDLEVFSPTDGGDGVLGQVARFLKIGALFDIGHLIKIMKEMLGELTFQEAYNRTRRILNIGVSTASMFELPRLLNYVTAPNVIIWSAVAASCSVPLVFSSADILAKDPATGNAVHWNPSPQRWIDGSVDNDLPMTRLSEMFNVNHFIVSQVNPHVVPFLAKEEDNLVFESPQADSAINTGPNWLHLIANMAKDEAMHRMLVMAEFGIFSNLLGKARSILSQRYSGDITILPEVSFTQMPKVLQNPTPDFMLRACVQGERATWPKLSRIQNQCAIELALDDAVQHLRARIAFSPSQVDLRLNAISRPISRAGSDSGRRFRTGRKRLRFSRGDPTQAPTSQEADNRRPLSFHEQTSEPAKAGSDGFSVDASDYTKKLSASFTLSLKTPSGTPLFSTGRGDDDDRSSLADSITPTPSEEFDSGNENGDLSHSETEGEPGNSRSVHSHLAPFYSQPTTPLHNHRRYFSGPSTPIPSMAPIQQSQSLAITPIPSSPELRATPALPNITRKMQPSASETNESGPEQNTNGDVRPSHRNVSFQDSSPADLTKSLSRQRRSFSTGMRMLKPPSQPQ